MTILGFHVVDRYHLPDGKIGMFVRSALWQRDPKGVFWIVSQGVV